MYTVLFLWTNRRGGIRSSIFEGLMQNLGSAALRSDAWDSLRLNHVQPPGLNAFYALAVRAGRPMGFISVCLFGATVLTITAIIRALLNLGVSSRYAAGAGLLYGFMPSTVLASLYPYNTVFVGLLVAIQVLAMTSLRRRPAAAGVLWIIGAVGLFLVRPSFVWFFAAFWLAVPVLLLKRAAPLVVRWATGLGLLTLALVQVHYSVSFSIPTTSSWSGQNFVRALVVSGAVDPADVVRAAGTDPCLRSLATNLRFFGSIDRLDRSCFSGHTDLDATQPALQEKKGGGGIQHNSLARLQLTSAWNSLAWNLLREQPAAIPKMIVGRSSRASSFEVLTMPAFTYKAYSNNLRAGAPLLSLGRPVESLFPGAAILLATGTLVVRRLRFDALRDLRWVSLCLVAFHASVGVALEYGENMRFLQELYPLFVVLGSAALWSLFQKADLPDGVKDLSPPA